MPYASGFLLGEGFVLEVLFPEKGHPHVPPVAPDAINTACWVKHCPQLPSRGKNIRSPDILAKWSQS